MWLINWKLHFLEWKTRTFVLKFSPQITETCILGLWNFKIFWGRTHPGPLPPLYKKGDQQRLVDTVSYSIQTCWLLQLLLKPLYLIQKKQNLINKLIVRLPDRIVRRITFFFCLLDLFILDLKKKKKTGEKRRVHPNKCLFWIIFSTFLQNIFPFL